MAKVGCKIGLTVKLFKDSQFEFIRPEISVEDIDTEKEIAPQLELVEKAINDTWEFTKDQVSKKIISEMPNASAELELQTSRKFQELDKAIKAIVAEIKKIKKEQPKEDEQ